MSKAAQTPELAYNRGRQDVFEGTSLAPAWRLARSRTSRIRLFRWRTKNLNSYMSDRGVNAWIWAAFVWIGVIFFSSTTLASKWAEMSFSSLADILLRHFQHGSTSYGIVHLLADKGFHVTLFCVLAVLLWQALRYSEK